MPLDLLTLTNRRPRAPPISDDFPPRVPVRGGRRRGGDGVQHHVRFAAAAAECEFLVSAAERGTCGTGRDLRRTLRTWPAAEQLLGQTGGTLFKVMKCTSCRLLLQLGYRVKRRARGGGDADRKTHVGYRRRRLQGGFDDIPC